MPNLRFLGFVLATCALSACTQESKIKKVAQAEALRRTEVSLRMEAKGLSSDLSHLQDEYVKVLMEKTEVEVDKVEVSGDHANVDLSLQKVSENIRHALLEIAMKLRPSEQNAFNMSDGLDLIIQKSGSKGLALEHMSFVLKNADGWQVQN